MEGGESVASLGRELKINENSMHSWVKRYRQNNKIPFVPVML